MAKCAVYCRSTARARFHPLSTNIIMRHHDDILIHPCLTCTNYFLNVSLMSSCKVRTVRIRFLFPVQSQTTNWFKLWINSSNIMSQVFILILTRVLKAKFTISTLSPKWCYMLICYVLGKVWLGPLRMCWGKKIIIIKVKISKNAWL